MNNHQQSSNKNYKVNWQDVKKIAKFIMQIEKIDLNKYNFKNICYYNCYGIALQGKNVSFKTKNNLACWVDNNKYDVFEIPSNVNRNSFIVLAFNRSFNYIVLSRMECFKNKDSRIDSFIKYTPYGTYNINENSSIDKITLGYDLTFGGKNSKNILFDSQNVRKRAYEKIKTYKKYNANRKKK